MTQADIDNFLQTINLRTLLTLSWAGDSLPEYIREEIDCRLHNGEIARKELENEQAKNALLTKKISDLEAKLYPQENMRSPGKTISTKKKGGITSAPARKKHTLSPEHLQKLLAGRKQAQAKKEIGGTKTEEKREGSV